MRSLSSTLTAAQVASTSSPYVMVMVGGTTYITRVHSVEQTEQPFGGVMKVVLYNNDKWMNTVDHRGDTVVVSWGYDLTPSPETSNSPPYWVVTQKDYSEEGSLFTELGCIDVFNKLALERLVGGGFVLTGAISGVMMPGMMVYGATSGVRATIAQVYADDSSMQYIVVGRLTRNGATEAFTAGETIYVLGDTGIYMSAAGVTSWGATPSTGWHGDTTIAGILGQITSGLAGVVVDSSDGILTVRNPHLNVDVNVSALQIFQDLIHRTKCGWKMQESDRNIHFFNCTADPASPSYTYQTNQHNTYLNIRDRQLLLPNRIIVYNLLAGTGGASVVFGEDTDPASIADYGGYITEVLEANVQSNVEAIEIAGSLIRRLQMERFSGHVKAPMNVGQELYDYVCVVDDRSGLTYYAWVGGIQRTWRRWSAQYTIELTLGDLSSASSYQALGDFVFPNLPHSVMPPGPYQRIHRITSGTGSNRTQLTSEGVVVYGSHPIVFRGATGHQAVLFHSGDEVKINRAGGADAQITFVMDRDAKVERALGVGVSPLATAGSINVAGVYYVNGVQIGNGDIVMAGLADEVPVLDGAGGYTAMASGSDFSGGGSGIVRTDLAGDVIFNLITAKSFTAKQSALATFNGLVVCNTAPLTAGNVAESRITLGRDTGGGYITMGAIGGRSLSDTSSNDGLLAFYTRRSTVYTEQAVLGQTGILTVQGDVQWGVGSIAQSRSFNRIRAKQIVDDTLTDIFSVVIPSGGMFYAELSISSHYWWTTGDYGGLRKYRIYFWRDSGGIVRAASTIELTDFAFAGAVLTDAITYTQATNLFTFHLRRNHSSTPTTMFMYQLQGFGYNISELTML